MQGFTTTVQLPNELNEAIAKAVMDSFTIAKDKFAKEGQYPEYLNKKQAASYLNISYNTLMSWIKNNPDFPCSEIDGVVRFNRKALDNYMMSN